MSEKAFGGTALCEQHHIVARLCPYCEIDRLKEEIDELRKLVAKQAKELSIMREALERIAFMDNGVLSKGLYCSKIAKDALKTVEG